MRNKGGGRLFESRGISRSWWIFNRVFAASNLLFILSIWLYRFMYLIFAESYHEYNTIWWIGMFAAELWFGFYWLLTQASRWNLSYRQTFKETLLLRHENRLPRVDVFVCTADPIIEPPIMVINTVLSAMAYDYPPEKLSVYLSDDGGSELTLYALLEASRFAKHWIPYCKKHKIEPRSPAAYFTNTAPAADARFPDWDSMKILYEELKNRIESATELGRLSKQLKSKYNGFSQWELFSSRRDHDTILHIVIGASSGREIKDINGCPLPNLIYLAREKRSQHAHNFKAGAMNSLIRVSANMSNGPIILNVDCDMYSNSSQSVRDALCIFMDEEIGHEFAYVQFPQNYENVTKNDIYASSLKIISEVDFHGLDGLGGPLYIGTGCFHRRDALCGKGFGKNDTMSEWNTGNVNRKSEETAYELEERLKDLASCTFEKDTQWGNEVGLKYGCPVEDVITGLSIQCNGWKSAYYNPERKGFLGVAPTSLYQTLVQHKRWSEGDLLILLSKYSPAWFGFGRINPGLIMGYSVYCLWAPSSLAVLYYCIIPSLHLQAGISLFPQKSSPWFIPFAYIIISNFAYSLVEFLYWGGTLLGWWNDQRIWLYKRTSSYFFALLDNFLRLVGYSNSAFTITSKVTDQDDSTRYDQEIMDFGTPSPLITILATLAMLNLFCFAGLLKQLVVDFNRTCETMVIQMLLCSFLVLINMPLYQAIFLRKDKGKIPSSVTLASVSLALFACTCFTFLI